MNVPSANELADAILALPQGANRATWVYAAILVMVKEILSVQALNSEAVVGLCLASVEIGALAHEHGWDVREVQP